MFMSPTIDVMIEPSDAETVSQWSIINVEFHLAENILIRDGLPYSRACL